MTQGRPRWRDEVHRMHAERRRARAEARAQRPKETDVVAALEALGAAKGHRALEASVLWAVEDMGAGGRVDELVALRRAVDRGEASESALASAIMRDAGGAAAASLIGVGQARDPYAVAVLAALELGKRGYAAREAAERCAVRHMEHALFCVERGIRERGEFGSGFWWSFERQLAWIRAATADGP